MGDDDRSMLESQRRGTWPVVDRKTPYYDESVPRGGECGGTVSWLQHGGALGPSEDKHPTATMTATSADDDLVVSVPPASLFAKVPWLVRPSPGINYNFVVYMYLAGSVLALLLFLLEKQILEPLLLADENDNHNITTNHTSTNDSDDAESEDGGGDAWKEFAKGMQGMHFIFDPFVPCLFWSLIVRYHWLKKTTSECQEKKEN